MATSNTHTCTNQYEIATPFGLAMTLTHYIQYEIATPFGLAMTSVCCRH